MAKRILKRLYLSILGVLFFTFLFISCTPKKFSNTSAIVAVPPSSPVFIKINDFVKLQQVLDEKNEWWKLLGNIEKVKSIQDGILFIDSMMNTNTEVKRIINGKEIVVSFHPGANSEVNSLVIMPLNINGDQGVAENFLEGFSKSNHLRAQKRKFNKVSLYELTSDTGNDFKLAYAFHQGFLIFSSKALLVEEAIRQLDSNAKEENSELAPLLKTINKQAEINIFINHFQSPEIFSDLLSEQMKKKVLLMKNYSGWTELDATIKNEKIFISGFSNGDSQNNYFANILLHQQPGISRIERVLPSSIDFFSGFFLSDIEGFLNDYYSYLNNTDINSQNQNQLKEIEKATGFNLKDLFIDIFDKEIAVSSIRFDQPMTEQCKVLTIKTKSGSYSLNKLEAFQGAYFKPTKKNANEFVKDYKIDNQINIRIFKFPVENMPALLFGNLFTNVKTCWFTVYENYLIFSDSYSGLGKTILSNVLGETLNADNEYIEFQAGLTSNNNYTFFCNSSLAYSEADLFFSKDISNDILFNSEFGKFKYIAWQVSSSGNMIYNNACMYYNPELRIKPKTVWQSHLSSLVVKKPLIIENKYDSQNNEIIVVDFKNNVSLLNNVGRIVWQINVGSPVLGEIHLIDLKKNGEYQLVFNTEEKLFVVDRNGKDIENFPVNFSVKATNGVSVFDYENNKNYRFFVAFEDQQICAYESDGKLLEGWEPSKTDHIVYQPIQHFALEGKDYIIATDLMKDYIFDRKGNIRVQTDYVFQHSAKNTIYLEKRTSSHEPRLVTTDSNGKIQRTYFDGTHETIELNGLDDSHYFLAANVDGDDEMEYLFVQGNQIILQKNSGASLFNQKIDCEINNKPSVYRFSKNDKKIGITCSTAGKIFLFNTDGTLHSGLPLEGSSEFNIGFVNSDESNFNLLVGSPDGYLYNYLIE